MLLSLALKHFILIPFLDLNFHQGMTTITGETGAGKSILIDAIEIALGGKASCDVIQPGFDRAEITVVFDITHLSEAKQWLQLNDLTHEDDICILRRIIPKEGKTRCSINHTPVNLHQLTELAEHLIQICGQHAHQQLLKSNYQKQSLDDFAGKQSQLQQLKKLTSEWNRLDQQIQQLKNQRHESAQRLDYIQFQLKDFQNVKPQIGEFESLEQDFKRLSQTDKLQQDTQQAIEILTGDNKTALVAQCYGLLRLLEPYHNLYPVVQNIEELLASAAIQLQEAGALLENTLEASNPNPEHLQQIEARMSELFALARKYRTQPAQLAELQQDLENQLEQLENHDEQLQDLETQKQSIEKLYFDLAHEISEARQKSALELEQKIQFQLERLDMGGVEIRIQQTPHHSLEPKSYGLEDIHFLARTNPGQTLQLLSKVASGGELSRISLAIQTILTQNQVCALIFDEVDVGIGGKTAGIIGNMLRQLGQRTQVIAITHLPQVAVQGHHHLFVSKKQEGDQVISKLDYLDNDKRIEEISRMLGGLEITASTRNHAREMLEKVE
jgi:DNA repair protein RecN (Recombination protein N)